MLTERFWRTRKKIKVKNKIGKKYKIHTFEMVFVYCYIHLRWRIKFGNVSVTQTKSNNIGKLSLSNQKTDVVSTIVSCIKFHWEFFLSRIDPEFTRQRLLLDSMIYFWRFLEIVESIPFHLLSGKLLSLNEQNLILPIRFRWIQWRCSRYIPIPNSIK